MVALRYRLRTTVPNLERSGGVVGQKQYHHLKGKENFKLSLESGFRKETICPLCQMICNYNNVRPLSFSICQKIPEIPEIPVGM